MIITSKRRFDVILTYLLRSLCLFAGHMVYGDRHGANVCCSSVAGTCCTLCWADLLDVRYEDTMAMHTLRRKVGHANCSKPPIIPPCSMPVWPELDRHRFNSVTNGKVVMLTYLTSVMANSPKWHPLVPALAVVQAMATERHVLLLRHVCSADMERKVCIIGNMGTPGRYSVWFLLGASFT